MSPANRRIDNVLNNPSEKLNVAEHEDNLIVWAKWSSLIIEDNDEYSEEPNCRGAIGIKRADLYTNTTNNRKYTPHPVFCNADFSYHWPRVLFFLIILLGPAAATTLAEEASVSFSFSSPPLKAAQPAPVISFVGYASSPIEDMLHISSASTASSQSTTTTTKKAENNQDDETADDDQEEKKKKKKKVVINTNYDDAIHHVAEFQAMTMTMTATPRSLEEAANNILVESQSRHSSRSLLSTANTEATTMKTKIKMKIKIKEERYQSNNNTGMSLAMLAPSTMGATVATHHVLREDSKTVSAEPTRNPIHHSLEDSLSEESTVRRSQYSNQGVSTTPEEEGFTTIAKSELQTNTGISYASGNDSQSHSAFMVAQRTDETSWAVSYASSQNWYGITTSSSGQYVYAEAENGYIYMSSDYGSPSSWAVSYNSSQQWEFITTSSSGQYVYATSVGYIYMSSDYGSPSSWAVSYISSQQLEFITTSSSGQYVYATVYQGYIYMSSDYGSPSSWAVSYSSSQQWMGITTSSTGQYVYATVYQGYIYMSSDYGSPSSWAVSYNSSQQWYGITTSSSGQYVYAISVGYIYMSSDYGSPSSWAVSYNSSQEWYGITTSSSGQYVYATANDGYIYSGLTSTQPSIQPSAVPSTAPSTAPSTVPSTVPSDLTAIPSAMPTSLPSAVPSIVPSTDPSTVPSTVPLSEPTSQPSPAPTASPLLVSPFFREGWSLRTIADKLDLHLWVYIVFFAGMFLVLLAVDQLQLLGTLRQAIYSSSNTYISSASLLSGAAADQNGDADIHTGGDGTTGADNHVNVDSVDRPDDSTNKRTLSKPRLHFPLYNSERVLSTNTMYAQKARSQMDRQQSRVLTVLSATTTFYPYSDAFYAYVATGLTFFGCNPLLYPEGYRYPCSQRLLFSKGQSEDWLVYNFNTVNLLRCLFSVVTPLVSHYQWCWVYVLSLSISFFLTVFSNSVLITLVSDTSNSAILVVFNLIVMRAAVSLCDSAAKAVLRVLFSLQGDVLAPNSNNIVTRALVLLLIPTILTSGCAFLLVLAAIFTVSSQIGSLLLIFIVQVQLSSFLMDLLLTAIMFMPDFHMNVSMKGWVTIFTLGGYYHEMLLHHKNPTPFVHYRHNCLCGLLVLDLIVSKDYALKRGWPTSATNQDGGGGVIVDEIAYYDSLHNGRFAGLYMEMEGGVEVSVASLLQKHDEERQEQMKRADLEMQKKARFSVEEETINPMVPHIRQDAESRGATSGTDAYMAAAAATVAPDENGSFTEVSKKKEAEPKKEQRRLPFTIDRKQHQQQQQQKEEREKERKTLSKKLNMQFIRSMIFFEKEKQIELRDSDASLRSNNDDSV